MRCYLDIKAERYFKEKRMTSMYLFIQMLWVNEFVFPATTFSWVEKPR